MTKRPTYGIHSLQGNGGKRYDGGNTSKNVSKGGQGPHPEICTTRYVKRNSQQSNQKISNSQTDQKEMSTFAKSLFEKYPDGKEIPHNDQGS